MGSTGDAGYHAQPQRGRSVLRAVGAKRAAAIRCVVCPLGWCAKYTPGLFSTLLAAAVPAADKHLLSDERFGRHLRAIQLEAFRQGSRGAAYESFLQFRPWGFDLAEVAVPTHIWLGDRDSFVPRAMGEYLQRAIPHVDLHWAHGKGHFNIEDWDAILAACALDIGKRRGG